MQEGSCWETLDHDWGAADTQRLSGFLGTPEGKNFIKRLRAMSLVRNRSAVMKSDPWLNGQAAGYMEALADIELLAQFTATEQPEELESEEDAQVGTDASPFAGPMR
jgi:hypothetical protein